MNKGALAGLNLAGAPKAGTLAAEPPHEREGQARGDTYCIDDDVWHALFLREVSFTRDLVAPPKWPAGASIYTETGSLTCMQDLMTVPTSSLHGMMTFLWIISKFYELRTIFDINDILTDTGLFTEAWEQVDPGGEINIEASAEAAEGAIPAANSILMMMLYISSGTMSNKRPQTMISKASLDPHSCITSEQFLASFSPFSGQHDWVSETVTKVLFSSTVKVQRYFDSMGPLVEKWLTSHASAGSAVFNRMSALTITLGLKLRGPLLVFHMLQSLKLLPAFAVAHIQSSFQDLLLEGRLMHLIFMKVAGMYTSTRDSRMALASELTQGFLIAIDDKNIKEGEVRNSPNIFGRTIDSSGVRARIKTKMDDALEVMKSATWRDSICVDLAALDCNVISYRSLGADIVPRESLEAMGRSFGLTPEAVDRCITRGLGSNAVVSRLCAEYLAAPAEQMKYLVAPTKVESERVRTTLPWLRARSKASDIAVEFLKHFKEYAPVDYDIGAWGREGIGAMGSYVWND